MKSLLLHLNYSLHEWLICGDIKVISISLGQQAGYTKYPCFRCLWDSRADHLHIVQRFWPSRDAFTPGKHNMQEIPLVDPKKVLFPPLHIKLGLMKNFVKVLDRDGPTFKFLEEMFPQLSEAKFKSRYLYWDHRLDSCLKIQNSKSSCMKKRKMHGVASRLFVNNFLETADLLITIFWSRI